MVAVPRATAFHQSTIYRIAVGATGALILAVIAVWLLIRVVW